MYYRIGVLLGVCLYVCVSVCVHAVSHDSILLIPTVFAIFDFVSEYFFLFNILRRFFFSPADLNVEQTEIYLSNGF